MKRIIGLVAALLLVAGTASAAEIYWDEGEFLAAIAPAGGYLLEEFTGLDGLIDEPLLIGPQNGYQGLATTEGPGDVGLWGCSGSLSTNSALNLIYIEFTDSVNDVYSTGGFFWPTDFGCAWIPGQNMVLTLSDGTSLDYVPASPSAFVGFVSDDPLEWLRVDAPEVSVNAWATIDHYYIDSPEPGSLALLLLGAVAALRRR